MNEKPNTMNVDYWMQKEPPMLSENGSLEQDQLLNNTIKAHSRTSKKVLKEYLSEYGFIEQIACKKTRSSVLDGICMILSTATVYFHDDGLLVDLIGGLHEDVPLGCDDQFVCEIRSVATLLKANIADDEVRRIRYNKEPTEKAADQYEERIDEVIKFFEKDLKKLKSLRKTIRGKLLAPEKS